MKIKLICLISALAVAFSSLLLSTYSFADSNKPGDCYNDSVIDAKDCLYLRQVLAAYDMSEKQNFRADLCDVNVDTKTDIRDLLALLNIIINQQETTTTTTVESTQATTSTTTTTTTTTSTTESSTSTTESTTPSSSSTSTSTTSTTKTVPSGTTKPSVSTTIPTTTDGEWSRTY